MQPSSLLCAVTVLAACAALGLASTTNHLAKFTHACDSGDIESIADNLANVAVDVEIHVRFPDPLRPKAPVLPCACVREADVIVQCFRV